MAMRTASTRFSLKTLMEGSRRSPLPLRYLSDDKGRIFSEEEKAAENIYIQKMERERLEKLRKKVDKEKAAQEKEAAAKKSEDSPKD